MDLQEQYLNNTAATVRVKIGRVAAQCPVCTSGEFLGPSRWPGFDDVLSCRTCRMKFTYHFLVEQVTRRSFAAAARKARALEAKLRHLG